MLNLKKMLRAGLLVLPFLVIAAVANAEVSRQITHQVYPGDELGLSPYWDWKTIETEHFRLTFPKELSETAQRSAGLFEEANALLTAKLDWQPIHKTQVLLIDNADAANGLTSAVARFGIVLYITPPDNWFSTAYYEDWLRLLILHEYTHLVNMDTTRGLWEATRILFGDVLLPNSAWPSWMLEGLAVYMETRYTRAGRGRSPYYEMLLRSAISENVMDDPAFITLDMVNGPNPYYPFGETAYTFGYQLMNQVARQPIGDRTADGESKLPPGPPTHEGENMLGEMSWRSGNRIPFFINGNLENISARSWYTNWALMIQDAKERVRGEIAELRSQPQSKVHVIPTSKIKNDTFDTLGMAFSPDGRWLAYTQTSSNQVQSLYLMDRKNGSIQRVGEKIEGATVSFTPDSKNLLFSTLNRKGIYYLWSDLKVHSMERGSQDSLSDSLRARDPDVSRDGEWVTFTISRNATTGLAIAPLKEIRGKLTLGKASEIFWPASMDAVHTPKFSADGKSIYFSWHVNGKLGEQIAMIDRATDTVTVLVKDGSLNRFPVVNPKGELYFVSDRTGVDNVYVLRDGGAELITNTETGLRFPAFDPQGQLYAEVFSYRGWQPAQVEEIAPLKPALVTIAPPPAPPADQDSEDHASDQKYEIENYSVIPSIWPRQWLPVILASNNGYFLGGQVLGFDAVDRHRYVLGVGYDSFSKAPDILLAYSNRSLGPDLSVSAENYTTDIATDSNGNVTSYGRRMRYSADARLPILWTYSSLTPVVSFYEERTFYKVPGANPSDHDTVAKSYWVPYLDTRLVFNESYRSNLAITTEKGRQSEIGSRVYFNSGDTFVKGYASDTEYLRADFLLEHSVLVPSVTYSWVDRSVSSGYLDTNVTVQGRQTGRFINTLPMSSLDQLSIRGYPEQTYYSKQAAVGSIDYRFPIAPVFRGWGTNPAFLEYIHGFVFGESAWFPNGRKVKALPSAGGGLQADLTIFNAIPLTASTEYHKGFREDFGGTGEVFFQLNLNTALPF
jgi:Tol biopolymer transport system component